MAKEIIEGIEAKKQLLEGARILASAVGSTLGPLGQNVAIDRGYDMLVVHDGVTVAKSISLTDNAQYAGVRLLRQAANKQVEEVGDGTTVVTILGHALFAEALNVIGTGTNAMTLRKGLEEASELLVEELDNMSKPVETLKEKIQVATISAEDPELGKMIGEIVDKLGADGVITVEESKSADTFMEHQEGMQLDKGFVSPYFITDPGRSEGTVEAPLILVTDKTLSNINEVLPFLEKIAKQSKSLVIIAPEFEGSALASFVVTKMNGGMNLLCIKAPQFGQVQKDVLQDIAVLTGGQVITEDAGMKFDQATLEMLGKADRVTATKDASLIVGGKGEKIDIEARIESLRAEYERSEGSEFQQEKLRERIAKLSSGVAVLKVGGHTEVEMLERKERGIDAVAATQAAVAQGIVVGGEISYLIARKVIADKLANPAFKILYDALEKPFAKLVQNAGMDAGRLAYTIETSKVKNAGIDVTDGQIKDMFQAGIIDPVKVPKSAIRNSISVAIQMMTTNTLIIPEIENKTKADNSK